MEKEYVFIQDLDNEYIEKTEKELNWMLQKLFKRENFFSQYEQFDKETLLRFLWLNKRLTYQKWSSSLEAFKLLNELKELLNINENSKIRTALETYLDNSGDKQKLKKRVAELEEENRVLKNLLKE